MGRSNLRELPKIRDSLSYLYVEHVVLEQNGHAISAFDKGGETHIPCAALAAILLGPGTKITHAAVKTLAENGCSLLWVGEDGVRTYAQGMGATHSARRLLRQAQLHADPTRRAAVVFKMYQKRFAEDLPPGLRIEQVRGREGVRVRSAYAKASRESSVSWHGRCYDRSDWSKADPINRALSTGAACLYGICHAGIVAAGYSTALGFIHTGKLLSFVYDVADLYRVDTVVPAAFEVTARYQTGEVEGGLERAVRLHLRDHFREKKILKRIVRDLDDLMKIDEKDLLRSETLFDGEDDAPGFLWDQRFDDLTGGRNFGPNRGKEGSDESEG
jgi:CRISPR-associated protein Cas1